MMNKKYTRRELFTQNRVFDNLASAQATLPHWMPRLAFAQPYNNPAGDVLVVVFLRGGADSLNMIIPHGDERYYEVRPRLAIPRPDDNSQPLKTLDLDGFFGIHPALSPLLPIFNAGQMKAVHGTGSPHDTRSHFEAMDFMERGTPNSFSVTSGWVGRHLATVNNGNTSPVRGVGWGTAIPTSLLTAPSTIAMKSIVDYHLNGDTQLAERLMRSLMSLYTVADAPLMASAQATQAAIEVIQQVDYATYIPQNNAEYPETDFALALRQTAALIRAQVGLEVACVDLGGWDTHANQGGAEGQQARLMTDLANGLAAFHQDLGMDMSRVSMVVMSEFGRRVSENANFGTDHGHGGAVLVMGDNFDFTAPVLADWVGLNPDVLADNEDLAITIDYRDILGELLMKRLGNSNTADIFPDYNLQLQNLFR